MAISRVLTKLGVSARLQNKNESSASTCELEAEQAESPCGSDLGASSPNSECTVQGQLEQQQERREEEELNSPVLDITDAEFSKAALAVKGIVGMIGQTGSVEERMSVLTAGQHLQSGQPHPVYQVFSYISRQMGVVGPVQPTSQHWVRESVLATVQLLNLELEHSFVTEALEICCGFVEHSVEFLLELEKQAQQDLTRLISLFGSNKKIGKFLITSLLRQLSLAAEKLRDCHRFRYDDPSVMEGCSSSMTLLLETWPRFLEAVSPTVSSKAGHRSRDRVVKQKLSLVEVQGLVREVEEWRAGLEAATLGLSLLQPDFCQAAARLDQLCAGLINSLTNPR